MENNNLDIDREKESYEYANAQPIDLITVKLDKRLYDTFSSRSRRQIEIQHIEPQGIDYSCNENWLKAKKSSTKAYKDLKKIEYDIRQGKYKN